ncbi:MAG TPA: iron dependent repressor, metal binding and dimerization domain protein [Candidatus Polarisedimenticolia bacterium]|nr:iron dependent repressor, metal binding and dimerization domain protein [Candidatus Polarisedimenticolia bacterium]
MRALGILAPGREPALTPAGHARAESLIRRQRLAETLFTQTFQMQEHLVEEEACFFEHILSPAMTDSICTFLGHPPHCPHGKPIPRGPCCRVAGPGRDG